MQPIQRIFVTCFELAVTFLVPAVVWITLIAGLIQFIYSGVHRLAVALFSPRRLAPRSTH